jgi:hypothetical protein
VRAGGDAGRVEVIGLVLAVYAAIASDPYCSALWKEQAAERALFACLKTAETCEVERSAYWKSSDAVESAIAYEMKANLAGMETAMAHLSQVTDEANRYMACRRSLRWWEIFSKRCRIGGR